MSVKNPIVAITGQVATSLMGTDAFQEVDIFGITMPVVKHSFLVRTASEYDQHLHILHAVEAVNDAQKKVLVDKIKRRLGTDLTGRHFAVWGLAFKPNTDDMREAPSRPLIAALLECGASVSACCFSRG